MYQNNWVCFHLPDNWELKSRESLALFVYLLTSPEGVPRFPNEGTAGRVGERMDGAGDLTSASDDTISRHATTLFNRRKAWGYPSVHGQI